MLLHPMVTAQACVLQRLNSQLNLLLRRPDRLAFIRLSVRNIRHGLMRVRENVVSTHVADQNVKFKIIRQHVVDLDESPPLVEHVHDPAVQPAKGMRVVESEESPVFGPIVDAAVEPVPSPCASPVFGPMVHAAVEPIPSACAVDLDASPVFGAMVDVVDEPIPSPCTVDFDSSPAIEPMVDAAVEPLIEPAVEYVCPCCRLIFQSELLLATHRVYHTQADESYVVGANHLLRCPVTALDGLARDYRLSSDDVVRDVPKWMREQLSLMEACLSPLIRVFVVKAMMYVHVKFVRICPTTGDVLARRDAALPSGTSEHVVDLHEWYDSHITQFCNTLEKYTNVEGSDWMVDCLNFVQLKVSLRENVAGRGAFVLPAKLKYKTAVINVECERACFKYAVLSVLHYNDVKTHRQRVSKYAAWENELKFDGLDVDEINITRDVPKFEKMNDVKVNVHIWEKGLKGIRYNCRRNTSPRTVNLLLVINENGQKHYCGIPKLSRLYYHSKKAHTNFTCERCTQSFNAEHTYKTHYEWCSRGKAQIEVMPRVRDYMYSELGHELSPLRVVYADAECFIEPETKTHQPAAFGVYDMWHAEYADRCSYRAWDGEGCVEGFLRELELMAKDQFQQDNLSRRSMIITPQQQIDFNSSTTCPKCKTQFTDRNRKVRNHDHITGQFMGPLCHRCNAQLSLKRNILPVIFHNLKNYDSHLIIKHGIEKFKHWKLSVIAQTTEKFMTLRAKVPVGQNKSNRTIFYDILFIDSFQFMSSSLSNLANNLQSLPVTEQLKHTTPTLSTDVLRRKGVFPYSYFSSPSILDETSLPSRDNFKNDLTNEECSEEDYTHAHRAWREFECRTFKDYLMRYLELDVRILADVFEEFRHMSLRQDGLDPVHFVSLPGLSFMSAFKMTGETIHLLQEPFLYNLFERGIRGGLTFVNTHHAKEEIVKVGTKDMKKILLYIDQNNLYGSAMSEYLPHSNFLLLTEHDIQTQFPTQQHILNLNTEGDQGYYFEVDLHYPASIHQQTSDFPLAPESAEVTENMLSPFMKDLHKTIMQARLQQNTTVPKFKPTRKLLMSQYNKHNYCIHFKLLQYFINKGMQVTKIHNVVQFTQKQFLKPYIDFNSRQRAQAQNTFEKDFYKLKNNSLFGKTMEDVRKHSNYKLVTNKDTFQKLAASPLFYDRDIITEHITGIKMIKSKVTLNRPIYIGQAVLDHSKHAMYTLFYETLPSCPLIHNIKLLGGDTDSFFLSLTVEQHTTKDDILSSMKQYVDFSNYPPSHPLHSNINKAKLGCFKDEVAGREIEEMVLLRPKMYSIKIKGGESGIKRAKGIGRSIVRDMCHADYQQAFYQHTESTVNMTILRSKAHTIRTVSFHKRGLSCWEDKRVWLSANESLPHGNVESPVPPPRTKSVLLPACGDVDTSHVVAFVVSHVVEASTSRMIVVDDEGGQTVGFDGEDEEEVVESETAEDRQFIDDDECVDVMPLCKRLLTSEDEEFDVAVLAKRCRFS